MMSRLTSLFGYNAGKEPKVYFVRSVTDLARWEVTTTMIRHDGVRGSSIPHGRHERVWKKVHDGVERHCPEQGGPFPRPLNFSRTLKITIRDYTPEGVEVAPASLEEVEAAEGAIYG